MIRFLQDSVRYLQPATLNNGLKRPFLEHARAPGQRREPL